MMTASRAAGRNVGRDVGLLTLLVLSAIILTALALRLLLDSPFTPPPIATTRKKFSQLRAPGRDSTIIRPGQSLKSPNEAYSLSLQPNGDLTLTEKTDLGPVPVWWTATGDNRVEGGHRVLLAANASGHYRLEVQARLNDHEDMKIVWHSDLEPECRDSKGESSASDEEPGTLQLHNSGRLRIAGQCDLFRSLDDREDNRSLAVIVAGLYRTHNQTCPTHMKALDKKHSTFRRIDVFAYLLCEGDSCSHRDLIESSVKSCYGSRLRRLEIQSVDDEREDYPGGDDQMLQPCGPKLRRLNNQLKTVHLAGAMWRSWAIDNGMMHDTVLRIRPDTGFDGDEELHFWALRELASDKLVLPHPRGEHYFYCAQMSGRVGVGPTDQIAYGSPAAMGHWLSMYQHFAQMVDLAANPTRSAHRDFSGCEVLPAGPRPEQCPEPAPCSIECLVAWYLESQGIQFHVEWNWNQGLVRG